MPRDLFKATMQGWARLDHRRRQRFAEAFLRAALRLERPEFREWLRRRVSEPRLPRRSIPARIAISQADIALLLRSPREQPRRSSPQRNSGNQTNTNYQRVPLCGPPINSHTPRTQPRHCLRQSPHASGQPPALAGLLFHASFAILPPH